jgi:hypothetical protein
VQRLLGSTPECAEDKPMALSRTSSSHTHFKKPQQQVKTGCLARKCAYNTGTMDTAICNRYSIC